MQSQKLLFGDIISLDVGYSSLVAFPSHIKPRFVSSVESVRTSFRKAHFQIFPASTDPISKLVKSYTDESVSVKKEDDVIFYHVETKSLLCVTIIPEDSESKKVIDLAKSSSEGTVFRIVDVNPNAKFDGEEIWYDQPLKIKSHQYELFLTLGEVQSDKIEINPSTSYSRTTTDFPKVMPRRNPHDFPGNHYQVALTEDGSKVKFARYQSAETLSYTKNNIANGDYIRIRYIDKWLTFYPNQDEKKDVYFESINDRFQPYNFIHTIFQVLDEQSTQGESIVLGDSKQYIFRHFVTGNYIHFDSPTTLKAYSEIIKSETETVYCQFEAGGDESVVREKLPLRIRYPFKQDYEAYLKPTEAIPVKNVQFETNTLYFFGFKVPEEYSYKNQKNLTRMLAEVSSAFELEGYNIVLEKVSSDEMEQILEMEQFANELQITIDLISAHSNSTTKKTEEVNRSIKNLTEGAIKVLQRLHKVGKITDEEEKEDTLPKKYSLEIADRYTQALIREFRIFDLIHMLNFLFIKKVPKVIEVNPVSEKFNLEAFLTLYEKFSEILLNSLRESISNKFYNSQYIRIYIHFMSESCDGVFKGEKVEAFAHKMRKITLELLKMLLWDDDLDGLGQLNFYQTMIFNSIRSSKNFQTYHLELLEHISSSKAYNLINSFRDSFITTFLTSPESFKAVFPVIYMDEDEIFVEFNRSQALRVPLSSLPLNQEVYNYFIVAFRVIVSLSTSKFVTFYHQFIKYYPLNVLQSVLSQSNINVEIKMLVHLIVLYVYFDYMKLPFSFIPPNIQTSNDQLRQILNQEEKKIVEFCKTCIGDFEKQLLADENINDQVANNINNLNTQDCSQQINLLELFLASEPDYHNAQVAIFYIQSVVHNGNITIHFLNKAKEALIRIKKIYQNSESPELKIIPDLLEQLALVNQKMKTHSTIAIYNQVIKAKNPDAEGYSRKIISGLKKIHFDSFAPIDMISLNEPIISGISLKYLLNVAKYEDSIADELDKFVILSSSKDVEVLKETIDIALTLNQNTRKYYVQKEKEGSIILDGEEYVQNLALLERLLTIIYDPSEHFLLENESFPNEFPLPDAADPVARFFRVLRLEKVAYRDHPFMIRAKAVSKLQQRIFALLSIQDILLRLVNCTINLTVPNKPADAPAEGYQPRLILVILIAFVNRNKSNQDLLSKSHGFISLYYQQKYIDKSCDTLSLFAEVMRDNEELLEVTKKFIYDITCYTFLGTIKPRAINKDSGAYLCTAIMSMHYLDKADIPIITYDTFAVADGKLDDLIKNEFSNLDLVKKIQENPAQPTIEIDLPACYYNIRQMLDMMSTILTECNREGKKKKVQTLRDHFGCQKFVKGLTKPDYRFQFELKSLFLKCIAKMHMSKHDTNPTFLSFEDLTSATELFTYLLNELFEFLLFASKGPNKEASEQAYSAFSQATVIPDHLKIGEEEAEKLCLDDVRKSYKEFNEFNLWKVRLLIFMDEIPLPVVWEYLYIFDQCWNFLAKLLVTYPEVIQATEFFPDFLYVSEQLISLTNVLNFSVLKKITKYFTAMEDLKPYEQYKDRIREIREAIVGRQEALAQKKDLQDNKKKDKVVEDPTEKAILETIVDHMRDSKQKDMQANIEMFVQVLSSHSAKRSILSELLTVIRYNPVNLQKEITAFVTKFFTMYLKKSLPTGDEELNETLYADFYKVQSEITDLEVEKSLIQGIMVARNIENIVEKVRLVLSYGSGYNLKVIERLKQSLKEAKYSLLWSDEKNNHYEANVAFILEEICRITSTLNDSELTKFLQYSIRSHSEFINPESDEIRGFVRLPLADHQDSLKRKMQSFFQEYANKDMDEVYKELGPLPVTIDTIFDLFSISSTETASLKIAKYSIFKSIRENGLESAIIKYFQKRAHTYKEKLELVKNDAILLLDLYISKIKYSILISE